LAPRVASAAQTSPIGKAEEEEEKEEEERERKASCDEVSVVRALR